MALKNADTQLDTRWWNLTAGATMLATAAFAATACGPLLEVDTGAETEGESETESGPGTDTIIEPPETDTIQETDTTPPEGCADGTPCPDGFYCDGDTCVEEYEYCDYDYGDCYCYYGHCSPPLDCYSDEECRDGSVCGDEYYGDCEYLPNFSDCEEPAIPQVAPVPIALDGSVVSLSFVDTDADGAVELVVGTTEGNRHASLDGVSTPLDAVDAPVYGAVSGDFDGDGATDLAVTYDVGVWVGWSYGTPEASEVLYATESPARGIVALERDDIPGTDLAVLNANGNILFSSGNAERVLTFTTDTFAGHPGFGSFARLDFDGDGLDDLVGDIDIDEGSQSPTVFPAAGDPILQGIAGPRRPRTIVTGDFDGQGFSDIAAATSYNNWTFIEASIGVEANIRHALYQPHAIPAVADANGDGLDDLLLVGDGGMTFVLGDPDWGLGCATSVTGGEESFTHVAVSSATDEAPATIIVADTNAQLWQFAISFGE